MFPHVEMYGFLYALRLCGHGHLPAATLPEEPLSDCFKRWKLDARPSSLI
jgi:hypothetical protein